MPRPVQSPPTGKGLLLRLRRLIADRRGVGAIEFAIVAPLLVLTYVGAFEITVGVTAARKVSRASSNVSDLLTRSDTTDTTKLDAMKDVTKSVVAPFAQNQYSLKMTGIAVDASGNATVAWSRGWSRGAGSSTEVLSKPYTKGDPVTLPENVESKGSFIVRTEFEMKHPILLMAPSLASQIKEITLSKDSYFRLRKGTQITCSDC